MESSASWCCDRGPIAVQVADPRAVRDVQFFRTLARLKPDVSLVTAQTESHAIAKTLEQRFPKENRDLDVTLVRIVIAMLAVYPIGLGLIFYIVAWIAIPQEHWVAPPVSMREEAPAGS